MRILHTSDWHVGKSIRGHSRADEHRAVLAEMATIAADRSVDLITVAGDLYETSAPNAESELVVNQALLNLAEVAPVFVVCGNHDNPKRFEAVAPLLALGRVQVAATVKPPDQGGVVDITAGGEPARVALIPFLSQRSIVKARDLMEAAAYENAQNYGERMARIITALSAGFDPDRVNLIVAHAFVTGGISGGGERPAHLVEDYGVTAVDFPVTAGYVALGHLHRAQRIPGPSAIYYSGSPLQLDFGEQQQTKQVNLVEISPGLPAGVEPVELTAGRDLRTLTGTVAELEAVAGSDLVDPEHNWVRVRVTEPARAGLADTVRDLLGPAVVDVRVERAETVRRRRPSRQGRSPSELFGDYLDEVGVDDPRVTDRFAQLLEQVQS